MIGAIDRIRSATWMSIVLMTSWTTLTSIVASTVIYSRWFISVIAKFKIVMPYICFWRVTSFQPVELISFVKKDENSKRKQGTQRYLIWAMNACGVRVVVLLKYQMLHFICDSCEVRLVFCLNHELLSRVYPHIGSIRF